jgi:hypothetical protein
LIDDGLLVDYIKRKNNISFKESVDIIAGFVAKTKDRLNNKEIVILPQIGRLYKDYENNLRFLQDTTNFNTSAFGLPTLQFYPILRSQETPIIKKIKPVKLVSDNRNFRISRSFSRKIASAFLPLFIGLVIAAFAIGVYKNQKQENLDGPTVQIIPVNENRINKKPSIDNISYYEGISENEQFENEMEAASEEKAEIASRRATISEEQKECVIIIGVFSKKAGVEKRVEDIYNLGYVAYQDKKGVLNRVGVQFAYEQKREIKNMLNIMREKFDSHAWILKE